MEQRVVERDGWKEELPGEIGEDLALVVFMVVLDRGG